MTVLQGYGATETGTGSSTRLHDHGLGHGRRAARRRRDAHRRGRRDPVQGADRRSAATGRTRPPRPRRSPRTAGTGPATSATSIRRAGSILSGRIKDIIVLPNGFNVYPEDIENALRIAGIRDSVVLETQPGRIEAVVLGSSAAAGPPGAVGRAGPRRRSASGIDAAIKAANATLGPNQRIAGWRLWPEEDFPRTHTLKIKRAQVRAWVAVDAPLPVA